MRKSNKINAIATIALAATTLFGASAFADSRHSDETWRDRDARYDSTQRGDRAYRDNERVTMQGRVQSFTRERGGYRVQLDRGGPAFWIPESRMHGADIRVGINISLGGVWRNDSVYVDDVAYGYGDGGYYNGRYVTGIVDRISYRRGTLVLRDDRSGRFINVDMRATGRYSRIDLNDLRRGDRVSLNGDWSRGGIFRAYEIDSVNTGRY